MDAHEHDELEGLRSQWQSMKINCDRLDKANEKLSRQLSAERAVSKQEKLARHYRRIGLISLVLLPMLSMPLREVVEAPVWMCVVYALAGVVFAVLDLSFSSFVQKSDYISLPTCEAIAHAARVLVWQARIHVAGIAVAVVVIAPMFVHFYSVGKEILWGGVAGGVIGAAIGLSMFMRYRRMARRMLADLESE